MVTLLEQIAALVAALNEVRVLCENIVTASVQRQADYAAGKIAQDTADSSSAAVASLAQAVIDRVGPTGQPVPFPEVLIPA